MATRIIRTGRWVPDDVPTPRETYVGNGMTQLTTYVEPPEKEIQYFKWEWPEPKRKSNKWVYNSIAVASIAGCVAVLLILIFPIISTVVICASLTWLGLIGYANRKEL